MTDKDINKLAQSYVDELFAHDDMQEQETIDAKNDALVMCMAFAGHILETHCIVEKDEILTAHKCEIVNYYEEQEPRRRDEFLHGVRLLESIFGKDMFEEEKE